MSKLERRLTVVAVVLPFAAFLTAIVLLWGGAVTGLDLAIFAVMYVLVGFGVTVGFHRLLTHRSFSAPTPVRAAFAILGSMSVQGAVIHWVADHRKHHTFTDEEGDPHSPHLHGTSGWKGVLTGMWHSHMGWMLEERRPASARRYARDLREDPAIRFVDRFFPLWVLLGLGIPFVAGFLLSGFSVVAGLTALLWAGLVRVFIQHHTTWSVNSICHIYGGRPFETDDESRNNVAVALMAFGEGWHHNHHAFPTSARHGLRRWQVDPSYWLIRALEKLGLAHDVKVPGADDLERKRRKPAVAAPPVRV